MPPTAADVAAHFDLNSARLSLLATRMRAALAAEVAAVVEEGADAIPEIDFSDIGRRSAVKRVRQRISRRGCVIVRGVFDRDLAEGWDREIGQYLTENRLDGRTDERAGGAALDGSGILGVYWSRPQIAARQHPNMVAVRRFLNGSWHDGSRGRVGFEPDHDIGYPDRLRRRAPGATARGLRPHIDAASTRGRRLAENRTVFAAVLNGRPDRYDPWDVAGRTEVGTAPNAPSSVFRTFQGWTALSDMEPSDGGLHLLPIPTAVAVSVVAGLAADLQPGRPVGTRSAIADETILPALVPIPAVEPGDTVWWHGDLFHSVAPAANPERWSNVMYTGVTPVCPRNVEYRATSLERFTAGRSPVDFPADDIEVEFAGRAGIDDLDAVGRTQFGIDPLVRT